MRRLLAECEANDRLRAEDPAAFEAKMRAQLPTSKCTLCGESFKGYGHRRAPRARRGRGVRRVQRGDRGAAALPQVVTASAGDHLAARSGVTGAGLVRAWVAIGQNGPVGHDGGCGGRVGAFSRL